MSFASDTKAFADKAKAQADAKVRAITLGLFRDVIMGSPVGNPTLWKRKAPKGYVGGRFRANWNCSVGSADLSTSMAIDPTGAMALAKVQASMGGAGSVTYLANGLPYGERLEYEGWSKQAPAGFVRVNVARYQEMTKL